MRQTPHCLDSGAGGPVMGVPCRADDCKHPLQDSIWELGILEGGRGRRHPLWLHPSSLEGLLEREAP